MCVQVCRTPSQLFTMTSTELYIYCTIHTMKVWCALPATEEGQQDLLLLLVFFCLMFVYGHPCRVSRVERVAVYPIHVSCSRSHPCRQLVAVFSLYLFAARMTNIWCGPRKAAFTYVRIYLAPPPGPLALCSPAPPPCFTICCTIIFGWSATGQLIVFGGGEQRPQPHLRGRWRLAAFQ